MRQWQEQEHPAHLEEILDAGVVRCHLSPRNCTLRPGQHGFCGVRANRDGRLVSLNYGKAVHATEETIETEAVNHYTPGERILSMGNIGCMLNCAYCHNWKTSQASFVSDKDVHFYSPEGSSAWRSDTASAAFRGPTTIRSSGTSSYSIPADLAKDAGLTTLYKSAFFITEEAVTELLPSSTSSRSRSSRWIRTITASSPTGWLEPVLRATEQCLGAGKHVEVSTLMITDISDNEETARRVSEWVLTNLDADRAASFRPLPPGLQDAGYRPHADRSADSGPGSRTRYGCRAGLLGQRIRHGVEQHGTARACKVLSWSTASASPPDRGALSPDGSCLSLRPMPRSFHHAATTGAAVGGRLP